MDIEQESQGLVNALLRLGELHDVYLAELKDLKAALIHNRKTEIPAINLRLEKTANDISHEDTLRLQRMESVSSLLNCNAVNLKDLLPLLPAQWRDAIDAAAKALRQKVKEAQRQNLVIASLVQVARDIIRVSLVLLTKEAVPAQEKKCTVYGKLGSMRKTTPVNLLDRKG